MSAISSFPNSTQTSQVSSEFNISDLLVHIEKDLESRCNNDTPTIEEQGENNLLNRDYETNESNESNPKSKKENENDSSESEEGQAGQNFDRIDRIEYKIDLLRAQLEAFSNCFFR
jgi:hypothetical protein